MKPLLTLLVMLVLVTGVQRLLSRLIRAVLLSYAPLSGDHSDSVVYHRSLLTPGDVDNRVIWALITAGGVFTWLAVRGSGRWGWLAALALLGALAWDLWTWERAAVSVRRAPRSTSPRPAPPAGPARPASPSGHCRARPAR